MLQTKAELIAIQKTLAQISETESASIDTVNHLRPLGYIFIRGDFPGGEYTVDLTWAGKSILQAGRAKGRNLRVK